MSPADACKIASVQPIRRALLVCSTLLIVCAVSCLLGGSSILAGATLSLFVTSAGHVLSSFNDWRKRRIARRRTRRRLKERTKAFQLRRFFAQQKQASGNQEAKFEYCKLNVPDRTVVKKGRFKQSSLQPNMTKQQPNEIAIPLTSPRPTIRVDTDFGISANALIDTGASSSALSHRMLKILEEKNGSPLPRVKGKFSVSTFAAQTINDVEVVLCNLILSPTIKLKNVPMVVAAGNHDMVIGCSLLASKRVNLKLEPETCYLTFEHNGKTHPAMEARLKRSSPQPLGVMENFSIHPNQQFDVELKLSNCPDMSNNLQGKDCIISPLELGKGIVMDAISVVNRKNKVRARLLNRTEEIVTFPEGAEIATAVCPDDDFWEEEAINLMHVRRDENIYEEIPKRRDNCACRTGRNSQNTMAFFADKYGGTAFKYSLLNPFNCFKDMKKGPRVITQGNNLYFLEDSRNSYREALNVVKKNPHKYSGLEYRKISVMVPHGQRLSGEQRALLSYLYRHNPRMEIVFVRNRNSCPECATLAIDDIDEFLANTDTVRLHIGKAGTQPFAFEMNRNKYPYPRKYDVLDGSKVVLARCKSSVKLFAHISQSYRTTNYLMNIIYWLCNHLRMQGAPKNFVITTDNSALHAKEVQDAINEVRKRLKTFQPRELKQQEKGPNPIVPLVWNPENCSCTACNNRYNGLKVPVRKSYVAFKGEIDERTYGEEDSGLNMASMIIQSIDRMQEEKASQDLKMEEAEARASEPGLKEGDEVASLHSDSSSLGPVKDALGHYPGEIDAPLLITSQHKPQPWRTSINPETFDPEIREELSKVIEKHQNTLSHRAMEWRFLKTEPVHIEFVDNELIAPKPIYLNNEQAEALDEHLTELLDNQVIMVLSKMENMPEHISPIFLVPKPTKEGEKKVWRSVLDLRCANRKIRPGQSPDHLIRDMDSLLVGCHGKKWATVLDISSAFWQIPVTEETAQRFAFGSPFSKLYRTSRLSFRSLPMGSSIAPSVWTRFLIDTLKTVEDKVLLYIDDILILSNTKEENVRDLDQVLQCLSDKNILVSAKKLKPVVQTFEYLGSQISLNGGEPTIEVTEKRKKSFEGIKPPTNKNSLARLLGALVWISAHFKDLNIIGYPLFSLMKTRGRTEFKLDEEQMKSFNDLIKALDNLETLWVMDPNATIYSVTDASVVGMGNCVYMLGPNKKIKAIRFFSKRFPVAFSVSSSSPLKEMVAIFIAEEHNRRLLRMAKRVVFITDLSAVLTVLSHSYDSPSPQMARLSFKLWSLPYNFAVRHASASSIPISDLLSRKFEGTHRNYTVSYNENEKISEYQQGKVKVPDAWQDGRELTMEHILTHLRKEIMGDSSISDRVRVKRMKYLDGQYQKHLKTTCPGMEELPTLEAKTTELKGPDNIKLKVESLFLKEQAINLETFKISPNLNIKAISPSVIRDYQSNDEECNILLKLLTTVPKERLPRSVVKYFRVLDMSIIVRRKSASLPFSDPKNLKIYCPLPLALLIMAFVHLARSHMGKNNLVQTFNRNFITRNANKLATIICSCCKVCAKHNIPTVQNRLPGRFERPTRPNQALFMDVMFFPKTRVHDRNVVGILGIVDLFSKLFVAFPITADNTKNILQGLDRYFSYFGPAEKIYSDNASSLIRMQAVREFIQRRGSDHVTYQTGSAYRSESQSPIENSFFLFRRFLKLNMATYNRSHAELMHATIQSMNSRPLAQFEQSAKQKGLSAVTPYSLHFGIPVAETAIDRLLQQVDDKTADEYRENHRKILEEFNQKEDELLKATHDKTKLATAEFQVGDLVYHRDTNPQRPKLKLAYFNNLFEILEVGKRGFKVHIKPLFGQSSRSSWTSINDIKTYKYSELVELLPDNILRLLGRSRHPDELRKISNEGDVPSEFASKIDLPPIYNLRRRLAPPSLQSVPLVDFPKDSDASSRSDWSISSDSSESSYEAPQVRFVQGQPNTQQPGAPAAAAAAAPPAAPAALAQTAAGAQAHAPPAPIQGAPRPAQLRPLGAPQQVQVPGRPGATTQPPPRMPPPVQGLRQPQPQMQTPALATPRPQLGNLSPAMTPLRPQYPGVSPAHKGPTRMLNADGEWEDTPVQPTWTPKPSTSKRVVSFVEPSSPEGIAARGKLSQPTQSPGRLRKLWDSFVGRRDTSPRQVSAVSPPEKAEQTPTSILKRDPASKDQGQQQARPGQETGAIPKTPRLPLPGQAQRQQEISPETFHTPMAGDPGLQFSDLKPPAHNKPGAPGFESTPTGEQGSPEKSHNITPILPEFQRRSPQTKAYKATPEKRQPPQSPPDYRKTDAAAGMDDIINQIGRLRVTPKSPSPAKKTPTVTRPILVDDNNVPVSILAKVRGGTATPPSRKAQPGPRVKTRSATKALENRRKLQEARRRLADQFDKKTDKDENKDLVPTSDHSSRVATLPKQSPREVTADNSSERKRTEKTKKRVKNELKKLGITESEAADLPVGRPQRARKPNPKYK